MKKKNTIYLSSTYDDLKKYRRAVYDALRKSGYEVIGMEEYVAADDRVINACLKDIDECVDIYVGIFAFRYGHIPPCEHIRECKYTSNHDNWQELSITELEYRYAAEVAGLPCLAFVAEDGIEWDLEYVDAFMERSKANPGYRIDKLRNHLLSGEKLASRFSSPKGLAVDVMAAVAMQLQKSGDMLAEKAERKPEITWNIDEKGSPYPGLEHFTRRFVKVFFGRELEVDEILDRLHPQNNRFILISGDSGAGKSSFVDAGLLPRLEKNGLPGGLDCLCLRMVPSHGHNPWDALMRAFGEQARQAGLNECAIGEELVANPKVLTERVEEIIAKCATKATPVLFLDQMEGLFTSHGGEHVADFISALYAAVQKKVLWVVATIRSDHLHHCYHHKVLLQVLRGTGHYPLGQVDPSAIGDIIRKPAQSAGLEISSHLVRRISRESGSKPGSLPLLAFVLQRLFDKRDGQALSEKVYDKIGGVQGALGRHAEDIFETLDTKAKDTLERVFRGLVEVDDRGVISRRRAPLDQLAGTESAERLVNAFIDARLLVSGQNADGKPIIELAHEALIHGWHRLRDWLDEDRVFLTWKQRLQDAIEVWERNLRESHNLLQGTRLNRAKEYLTKRKEDLTQTEIDFIDRSHKFEQIDEQQKEEQRRKEWDEKRQETRNKRKTAEVLEELEERHKQKMIVWKAVSLVLTVTITVFFLAQLSQSDKQRSLSSVIVVEKTPDSDEEPSLRRVENPPHIFEQKGKTFIGHKKAVSSIAFAPDGKTLASGSWDKIIRLWDTMTGKTLKALGGHNEPVSSVAFAPDGKTLASASWDKTIRLWDTKTGKKLKNFVGHTLEVMSVDIAPDGRTMASASMDMTIRLWDITTGETRAELRGHTEPVSSVSFSPDGKTLASASWDKAIRLWDTTTGATLKALTGHSKAVSSVSFSPDGKTLASASLDETIRLWDIKTGKSRITLIGHTETVTSVAFAPDGKTLASASDDKSMRLWDAKIGLARAILEGHSKAVYSVAFAPDGKTLASASKDKSIRLWKVMETGVGPKAPG